jgi:ABC-type phosphate transport system substrate-binding protein
MIAASAMALSAPGIVVVVNQKNKATAISLDQLKKIYLGKTREFPTGTATTAIDQTATNEIKTRFNEIVLEKTAKQLQTYWSVQIFTGKGTPPAILGSDDEVKAWVAKNPEGIGYINAESVDATVKVVLRIP